MVTEFIRAFTDKRGRRYAVIVLALNAPLLYLSLALYNIVRTAGTSVDVAVSAVWGLFSPGGSWVSLVASFIALLLVVLVFLSSFRLGGLHWAIASFYILLALAAGLSPSFLDYRLVVASIASTLLALLSLGYRRALHFIVAGREWTVSFARTRGSATATIIYTALTILTPLLVALGASILVLSAARAIESLELNVPPPLPDVWNLFKSTRIGVFLALLAVILLSLWIANNVFETIIIIVTLRRDQALELARNQALREYTELGRFSGREDRASAWILSSVGALLFYPVIYTSYTRYSDLLGRILGDVIVPRWVSYLAGLTLLMALLWITRRLVASLVAARGLEGRRWLFFFTALTASIIAYIYAVLGAEGALSVIREVLGLGEIQGLKSDPLNTLFGGGELWVQLETIYARIERLLKLITWFLWG